MLETLYEIANGLAALSVVAFVIVICLAMGA